MRVNYKQKSSISVRNLLQFHFAYLNLIYADTDISVTSLYNWWISQALLSLIADVADFIDA